MEVLRFEKNLWFEHCKDIKMEKDDKELQITYGGNLDLYFEIIDGENFESETVEYLIKNEDKSWIYFNRLFNDIINSKDSDSKNELVENNTINWYSDETYKEAANKLSIERQDEGIKLSFYKNPDYESYSLGIPIRIRNSGSRYEPFNFNFMKLYNDFQELAKNKERTEIER